MVDCKICSKCKENLPISKFSCSKRGLDGECIHLNSWCNTCRTTQNRKRNGTSKRKTPVVTENSKQCLKCMELKPFSDFSPSIRGRLGLSAYCKICHPKPTPDKARLSTQKYRDKNRESWRSKHRLAMFKRRNKIEAMSDGSITDDYLRFLYSVEHCCWCGNFTPPENRTLEHIIELNSGGMHSIDNTNMACVSCNSKRLNKGILTKQIPSLKERYNINDNHS